MGNFAKPVATNILPIPPKVSKSFTFLVKSFWATFIANWQLFTAHTARHAPYGEPIPMRQVGQSLRSTMAAQTAAAVDDAFS